MRTGDRIVNLMKCYLVREGLTSQDDSWPKRFFEEPIPDGPFKGSMLDEDTFRQLLEEYYEQRGWDKRSSIPTNDKLLELGLNDVADELERMGKYTKKRTGCPSDLWS